MRGLDLSVKPNRPLGRRSHTFRTCIFLVLAIITSSSLYGYFKPLPSGVSIEGEVHRTNDVDFLYDLTFENESETQREQVIFNQMLTMIEEANEFIIFDMFLFNDEYERTYTYPSISLDLTNALIQRKKQDPTIDIVVITDPINTFYGSYTPEHLHHLKQAEIDVVYTDLKKLRDSNPLYSGTWRSIIQWFGTSEKGWLPNPLSPDSSDVTLRSYLNLLNFKANHRKVLINEQQALVTSANPHDASSYHSNIAFLLQGNIVNELIQTEQDVAIMSGVTPEWLQSSQIVSQSKLEDNRNAAYEVQLLTEGKIKKHLLQEITETEKGDSIMIGTFYLSDRDIVKELTQASKREVEIRLILDANKDAFGREKNGVPNRPVAHELLTKSDNKIKVRWYNTNGEQYHTKLTIIESQKETVLIGGSANLTKRNLEDFNLETNVKVTGNPETELMVKVSDYFERLWQNEGGMYTLDYEEYKDDSIINQFLYRFQEFSGLSSF